MKDTVLPQFLQQRGDRPPVLFENVPCLECLNCGNQVFEQRVCEMMEDVLEGRREPTGVKEVRTFSLKKSAA